MTTKTKTTRRELLQLAHTYKPAKHKFGGWMVSEKLDGSRCFWDGGITRGMKTVDVPWAGLLHPKKETQKPKIKPTATGLWSRYGNPIMAPDWFLDGLPKMFLDGELFCGRGKFQLSRSIVSGDQADKRWDQVTYMVYGTPPLEVFTQVGLIKNNSMLCGIVEGTEMFARDMCEEKGVDVYEPMTFYCELAKLNSKIVNNYNPDIVMVHTQIQLLCSDDEAIGQVDEMMEDVLSLDGEGLIVRNPEAQYICKRTHDLIKFKPFDDDDGILTGFTAGRGKYEGMIGALILDYNGKRLELSGMTDAERGVHNWVFTEPGKDMPKDTIGHHFQVGQKISFKYRELSDDGIPKEARYWRQRGDA